MSGVKHTPGPWEAKPHPTRQGRWFVQAHFYGDEIKQSDVCELSNDNREANARLIAAAPDLLSVAKLALKTILDEAEARDFDPPADTNLVAELEASITRATGDRPEKGEQQ